MKYFGYTNSKVNCLIGGFAGGQWVEVSVWKYLWLKFAGYRVKKEKA